MKKDLTELVFILDKSGSMSGLEADTMGGYNSVLKKQQDLEDECYITTVLFDNNYQLIHDRTNIKGVNYMTSKEYKVGGSTALLDAMGITINKIVNALKNTQEEYRADKVMFVIITDGEENSSREYTASKIKEMVERQKSKYGWEFIFLGANMDAITTASSFGISSDRAMDYIADSQGSRLSYEVMGDVVREYRQHRVVDENRFHEIREDAKKRRKD